MINETGIIRVRNVNDALSRLRMEARDPRRDLRWHIVSPRGMETMEHRGPMITEYSAPMERVLWSPTRDANPFFHLMESLWILAGRCDVKFLAEFNANMASYSDDGETFHAPYGYRLRHWEGERETDQIDTAIRLLRADHDTRQVVLSIWNPELDLGAKTKDMPCNDLVMLKIREGELNMTVCCRSNDAIWGAYGANAVQFSMLQEFIAGAVGVQVGVYRQVSDSFHVYTEQETWLKVLNGAESRYDPYRDYRAEPYPLFRGLPSDAWRSWLAGCETFCSEDDFPMRLPFFVEVAEPMRRAWRIYRNGTESKSVRVINAVNHLKKQMVGCDWRIAAIEWLLRREVTP